MLAYVLNKNGDPLMPCSPVKARKLLKNNKAKVVSCLPFTIKLFHGCSGYKQQTTLKIDTGSKIIGCAVVGNGKTLYASEVKTRQDIRKKMSQRAIFRRNRRNRKTRYRKARFENRKRNSGWLTPTLRSKVQTHLKEICFVKSILPITKTIIEIANFDIHKLTNPNVKGKEYQEGRKKNFYNTKAFILSRDKYICQKCKSCKDGLKLNIHHIIFRSNGGTDSPDNLITLCESCHNQIHKYKNPEKESLKLQKKIVTKTIDAVQVSTIGSFLRKNLEFQETFGYETKYNREVLELPKAHFVDAICVGLGEGEVIKMPSCVFKKVSIACGDYQQTESQPNKTGKRSALPRKKIFGFNRFDKVKYFKTTSFIKGRMSTGYAILIDINGNKLDFGHTPKLILMKKIGSRKSWLTDQIHIENFTSSTISYSSVNIEKRSLRKKKFILK